MNVCVSTGNQMIWSDKDCHKIVDFEIFMNAD